jgi:hypothetical protein
VGTQIFHATDVTLKNQFAPMKATFANVLLPSSVNPLLNSSLPYYHYQPYSMLTGSNHTSLRSNSSLQLTKFTVAAWFKTNAHPKSDMSFIVNKGGVGSDIPGQNLNYGIWMENGSLGTGFETRDGTNYFVISPLRTYNDGKWHYVAATYSGKILRLYVDGVKVGFKITNSSVPDNTGIQPLIIGANYGGPGGFFTGNIDEVRVWNRKLSDSEILKGYNKGLFNTRGQLVYLTFG